MAEEAAYVGGYKPPSEMSDVLYIVMMFLSYSFYRRQKRKR